MSVVLTLVCVACSICASATVGAIIGEWHGTRNAGAVFGALLGPIGWLIVALNDYRQRCTTCGSPISETRTVCPHCRNAIRSRRVLVQESVLHDNPFD